MKSFRKLALLFLGGSYFRNQFGESFYLNGFLGAGHFFFITWPLYVNLAPIKFGFLNR